MKKKGWECDYFSYSFAPVSSPAAGRELVDYKSVVFRCKLDVQRHHLRFQFRGLFSSFFFFLFVELILQF